MVETPPDPQHSSVDESKSIWLITDINEGGAVEFEEFLRIASGYCMYTEEDILRCE